MKRFVIILLLTFLAAGSMAAESYSGYDLFGFYISPTESIEEDSADSYDDLVSYINLQILMNIDPQVSYSAVENGSVDINVICTKEDVQEFNYYTEREDKDLLLLHYIHIWSNYISYLDAIEQYNFHFNFNYYDDCGKKLLKTYSVSGDKMEQKLEEALQLLEDIENGNREQTIRCWQSECYLAHLSQIGHHLMTDLG